MVRAEHPGPLQAHLAMYGLTPGSVHDVRIGTGSQAIPFTPLTAGSRARPTPR